MRKLVMILACSFLLFGCSSSYQSAKDLGNGVSVEIQTNVTIKHLRVEKYVNGTLTDSQNVINANNSAIKKGEIVHFDFPIYVNDEDVEFLLLYSKNIDGTNSYPTNKLKITSTDTWVNLLLNDQLQLEEE